MTNWQIAYANEKIAVNYGHVEAAIQAACSTITKEICFNEKIKDNPAQKKAYEIHISVLRLLESVFKQGFEAYEKHQRGLIPRKRT